MMYKIEKLSHIQDAVSVQNIREMTECFVSRIDPLQVILFGSFAEGNYSKESDYDFYIVIPDGKNIGETSFLAYKSIRNIMKRPVDIVVGTKSRFEQKAKAKSTLMIEGEVSKNGIVLYDKAL